ncbi:MAG: hypothetical protein HYZ92_01990 [Candidatus Omnitrophica bacterium]|nr:hypothetical protein [Candidatus Omnitrophota bacterium]
MKRPRVRLDSSQRLLVEQALKLTPSERFQYALGLMEFALRLNPHLKKNRERLLQSRK